MSYTETSTNRSSALGTLTAFYDDRESADDAVEALTDAGISRDKITVVAGRDQTSTTMSHEEDKGFWASLSDFFMPDEDRSTYAEGLRRGGYLVTVQGLNEAESDIALDILDDEGTVDLDEREKSWRAEGWTGYGDGALGVLPEESSYNRTTPVPAATTTSTTSSQARLADTTGSTDAAWATDTDRTIDTGRMTDTARASDETIPVIEESLRVGKRDVSHGRVRVRSYVVETPVSEEISLHDERVTIDRRPVDRAVSAADALFEDRVIEAEEHSEEAVVSKEARVTEEIGIRKEQADRVETVSDTVRSTKVEVEDERSGSTRLDPSARKPI